MSITWQDYLKKIDAFLDDLLVKKAPSLGKGAKDFVVTILPWAALIFGLLGFLGGLGGLGVSTFFTPFVSIIGRQLTLAALFYTLITLFQSGLELLAVPYLFKKKKKGWQFLFYSSLLGAFSSLVSLAVFGLVFVLIGLYFLYQVKETYR